MAWRRQDPGPMLWIGAPCHTCHSEDFLPLVCQACHHTFCADHFSQDAHRCPYPHDNVLVPLCPLCEKPPPNWRRGASLTEIQNILEAHWAALSREQGGCPALLPDDANSATRQCTHPSCKQRLFVSIRVRTLSIDTSAPTAIRTFAYHIARRLSMHARHTVPGLARRKRGNKCCQHRPLLTIAIKPRHLHHPHRRSHHEPLNQVVP